MVVSAAFEELTEVLKCLESSDAEIQNVALHEQTPDTADEIAADLTVGIPVLSGVSLHDGVTIEAEDFDVQNQRIEVDLTVTLPVGEDAPSPVRHTGTSTSGARTVTGSQSNSLPSYKDPEALQAVYEAYDTFPEMTEALGADVTSETVRRYMVKYDIHDPSDNTPQTRDFNPSSTGSRTERESGGNQNESNQVPGSESKSTQLSGSESESAASEEPTDEDEPTGRDTTTDRGAQSGTDTDDGASDELGNRSVAEMLAESDSQQGDDKIVADGLGIPRDLTVAEFAAVINQSNTTRDVKQRLEMSQGNARRLLQELNLISFVTHRLAADQINVTPAEIKRRIESASH